MNYELWDSDTGNLMGSFRTAVEVAEELQRWQDDGDGELVQDLVLIAVGADGKRQRTAVGPDIISYLDGGSLQAEGTPAKRLRPGNTWAQASEAFQTLT